jgi:predicted GIY-YIG superfamily endonuclease
MSQPIGTVYLLHFDRPYQHARHYLGWALDLNTRLADHNAGRGARLLQVVHTAGIGWTLARTWTGATRNRERQLKRQGGASRCCPLCGVKPRRAVP